MPAAKKIMKHDTYAAEFLCIYPGGSGSKFRIMTSLGKTCSNASDTGTRVAKRHSAGKMSAQIRVGRIRMPVHRGFMVMLKECMPSKSRVITASNVRTSHKCEDACSPNPETRAVVIALVARGLRHSKHRFSLPLFEHPATPTTAGERPRNIPPLHIWRVPTWLTVSQ